ncbi:MAG: sialate O-acetylesterase [Mariniblastus sp.]|nr:sialate O-acetylesterase [Mariniblastus sp.]
MKTIFESNRRLVGTFVVLTMLLPMADVRADVRLPGFFSDHMVFQQQQPIKIWGWAEPGEPVKVELGKASVQTKAGEDGRWVVELPAMKASNEATTLKVAGKNRVELKDVLIGEVWLCSGQSNMEWTVNRCANAKEEIANANHPLIRHAKMAHRPSMVPLDDIPSEWQICSPETVANFTACGYYMARELQKELGVPIGLINSSWGGTRVEPWVAPIGFKDVPELSDIYQSVMGRTPGTRPYQNRLKGFIAASEKWLAEAKGKVDSTELLPASPAYPPELAPYKSHQDPTMLYNGMIDALVGFPIRGVIWYQGESNHTESLYAEKKKALIEGWRELWGHPFPFYYVQIAPFQYGSEPHVLAEFWEQQAAVEGMVDNTGMVVINDIATIKDIHPPNKQDVGKRLALLALKHDYGRSDLVAHSPGYESHQVAGSDLRVKFNNTGGGLKTRDGKPPTHFELVGPGSDGFQVATATIDGDEVLLTSEKVKEPTAFRFAWDKVAEPNLMGGTGLPVGAVRGGDVPDALSAIPGSDDYQLVYDLSRRGMKPNLQYDVDRSSQSLEFDRVAYLLELESDAGPQHLFVSMKAFTHDAGQIGVPTAQSQARFQQKVENMDIYSNVDGVTNGQSIATGSIEFWPHNYAVDNTAQVPGASNQIYDTGDQPVAPRNGYGSMQVHNHGVNQTLFAVNHWKQGDGADLGIGNSPGATRDWTFAANAGTYDKARLRVFVRPTR